MRALCFMVEVTGLEPAASCSQSRRATNCATPRYSAFQNIIKAGALPLAVPKIFFGKSLENFDRGAAKSSLYPPQEALGFCANCAAPQYLLTALLLYPYNSRLSNFLNNCVHTTQYFFIIIKAEAKNMNLMKKRAEKRLLEKKRKERSRLREDIENLEAEIKRTETVFNLTTDEYLLESAIFEHNAQKAKMNYLLRLAKDM